MRLEELEKRVQLLEDIEAIKKLKHLYCLYCDDNFDVENLMTLFTEDAVWDGGDRGRYEGHAAIRGFFQRIPQRLPFAIHMVLNPIIEVKGDTAHGTWYLIEPCTERGQALWMMGVYEDDYVKVDGRWKYKNLQLAFKFRTPYDQGWAKVRFV